MFLLLLMGLGAASVKAQVRIGGNTPPDAAAVLDLNADGTNTGTKTLALPRVSLTSATDLMGNASLLTGMLVYNTTATPGVGIYYWNGSNWVRPTNTYTGSTSINLNGTSFERAALTGDVTAAANSNATTIANGAVNTAKLADNSVTSAKIVDGTIVNADIALNTITSNRLNPTIISVPAATGGALLGTVAWSAYSATVNLPAASHGDILSIPWAGLWKGICLMTNYGGAGIGTAINGYVTFVHFGSGAAVSTTMTCYVPNY